MKHAVWKFCLPIMDRHTLTMPKGARILCVQMQRGFPYLWALVPTNSEQSESRTILCAGTGHERADLGAVDYIGTIQMEASGLVFHFFEENLP